VNADLAVDLGDLRLANPLVLASGTAGSAAELAPLVDLSRLGAVVAKSVTVEPRPGLPPPRMAETAGGLLNAIGLQNPGVDRWVARDLPALVAAGATAIASVAGKTVAEYGEVTARLGDASGIVAIEANISCPNVEDRGVVFSCRPSATREAVAAVVARTRLPVFAKLTADVTDLVEIAAAAREGSATGVTVMNTLLGMAIDVETARPRLGGVTGGLSGPAVKPVAVRAVYQVARALPDLPVIGLGGARTAEDVVEFVLAGASAVAFGTATFLNPRAAIDALDRLPEWLASHGHARLADLRGQVRT
jgi:dihydroorotate dehydrogenase (NAD+) catalytic subunit